MGCRAIVFSLIAAAPSLALSLPKENVQPWIASQTEFCLSFYEELNTSDSVNLLFSPYSLSTSLAMLFYGARGDTADEIQKTLHLRCSRSQTAKMVELLDKKIIPAPQAEKGYRLNVANALWVDRTLFVLSTYTHAIESSFHGKIGQIDFSKTSEATTAINQWISEQTQEKIKDLLHSSDIDPQTRLVLTNTIYFEGQWERPFDGKQTSTQDFFPLPDTKASVEMMEQTGHFPYFENDLFQLLALPFESPSQARMAYVILLPKSTENLPAIERDLSPSLTNWLSNWEQTYLHVQMPKFSFLQRFDLNQTLQKLGMPLAFSTQANFGGIDGKLDLYLSKVVHQAFIDVKESGVTAAAATAAAMNMTSALPSTPPISFVADHPFLFFILDLNSHEILFMGKFQNPL